MNTQFDERLASVMSSLAYRRQGAETPEQLYITKLMDMVPGCPKNPSVSKLEVIQHVIDYIDDLQQSLHSDSDTDSPPESPMDAAVHFSDAFSQQVEFHGYGSRPQQFQYPSQGPHGSSSSSSAMDSSSFQSGAINDDYNQPLSDFARGFDSYSSSCRSSQRH